MKKRGIDGPTAGRFGIGYAPNAWDTVLRQLGTSDAPHREAHASRARRRERRGSPLRSISRSHHVPDPQRARGQVIGFGGRVLDSGEPKYLNSPETPIFRKGHELYGLYEARQNPGRPKQIIVVEGYLDVASLVQFGVENVVATLGTAMTAENLRRLTRLTDRVMFCFDGDRAGRAAAWRAMETALPFGGGTVELKFLLLPEKDDPDSFRAQPRVPMRFGHSPAAPCRCRTSSSTSWTSASTLQCGAAARGSMSIGEAAAATPTRRQLSRGDSGNAFARQDGTSRRTCSTHLMSDDAPALVIAQPSRTAKPAAAKRKTAVQKVINLALHYPRAAARAADSRAAWRR